MARKQTSLSRRIFAVLMVFALVFSLAIGMGVAAACFNTYESSASQALENHVSAIAEGLDGLSAQDRVEALTNVPLGETRCTLIGDDGTVLYDSQADASSMENHADRSEVQSAKTNGTAVVARRSVTLGQDSLYAAQALSDGSVLRLAETRYSLASFIGTMVPAIVVGGILAVVVAYLIARLLTQRVVKPLGQIDLAHPDSENLYVEMQPLVDRLEDQRKELVSSNEELRRAANARREFTANVSHEMKTPLQVIGGYAELISNDMVPPEDVPRFAGLILSEAQSMRLLVDDVLTLSHLDEGTLVSADSPDVDLYDVAASAVYRLKPKAEDRVIFVSGARNSAVVRGNVRLLEQAVYNLVDNAVRYTASDGTVRVRVVRDGNDAVLTVDDNGQGIPEEYRSRVFERFFRIDDSRSRETGGTGLGLAIVKHTAEDHGGTTYVEESQWGGASFVIRIPLAHPETQR